MKQFRHLVEGNSHTFDYGDARVTVEGITTTRSGARIAQVTIAGHEDGTFLNAGRLNLSDARQRAIFAAQGARRNSGDVGEWETRLMEIALVLEQELGQEGEYAAPVFTPLSQWLAGVDSTRQDLVEGLMERGNTYLLAARYKAGKSLLVMGLIFAVSRGDDWLGRAVQRGRVYWLQLEDSDRIIARRWQQMAATSLEADIHIGRGPWRLAESNLDATIKAIEGADLVVVDPIISAAEVQNWSDMSEVRRAYDYWRVVARATNAVVLIFATVWTTLLNAEKA